MQKIHLYKYIKEQLADEYVLSVLYYCFRDAVEKNDYSLDKIKIVLDDSFLPEAISVLFDNRYTTKQDTLLLLLSMRALMLNSNNIKYCKDDNLIFSPCTDENRIRWVLYKQLIDIYSARDEDFRLTYNMLVELVRTNKITKEHRDLFRRYTVRPEQRNILNKFGILADSDETRNDVVICNNAFSFNDKITTYMVNADIKYVGNTAFSYCYNLNSIVFESSNVLFGKFSIIECPSLKKIIVPSGSLDYYKAQLPYYRDIIVEGQHCK